MIIARTFKRLVFDVPLDSYAGSDLWYAIIVVITKYLKKYFKKSLFLSSGYVPYWNGRSLWLEGCDANRGIHGAKWRWLSWTDLFFFAIRCPKVRNKIHKINLCRIIYQCSFLAVVGMEMKDKLIMNKTGLMKETMRYSPSYLKKQITLILWRKLLK